MWAPPTCFIVNASARPPRPAGSQGVGVEREREIEAEEGELDHLLLTTQCAEAESQEGELPEFKTGRNIIRDCG